MKTSAVQTAKAIAEGHNFCELGPVLADFAIDYSPCFGELTNAHSVKSVARGSDPVLDTETARSCTFHHYRFYWEGEKGKGWACSHAHAVLKYGDDVRMIGYDRLEERAAQDKALMGY